MVLSPPALKSTLGWTFSTVGIILALAFLWLVLAKDIGGPQEVIEGSAGPSSPSGSPVSGEPNFLPGEFSLIVSPSTAVAAAESNNVPSDNLAALVLGAAGTLSLAMLVLILARKRRHSAHPALLAEAHNFPQVVHRASSL